MSKKIERSKIVQKISSEAWLPVLHDRALSHERTAALTKGQPGSDMVHVHFPIVANHRQIDPGPSPRVADRNRQARFRHRVRRLHVARRLPGDADNTLQRDIDRDWQAERIRTAPRLGP